LACAAALASLELYESERLFDRAAELAPYWEDAVHGLKDCKNVIDIRNIGLVAGIELAPRDGAPAARGYDCFVRCFAEGLLFRQTGDTIALAPPLIIEKGEIDRLIETLGNVINGLD
jgi:beta-alanine--pyruvate transaminase